MKISSSLLCSAMALGLWFCAMTGQAAPLKTENVFLIVSDGFRWQEVFNGAEEKLLNKENGNVKDVAALREKFWKESAEARREALLPFFWTEIAKKGQIWGNQGKGSVVQVTNGKKFSYPGYSEMLTGIADSRIDSNDKRPNPNVTVFEWLNSRERFQKRVAVFGTWNVFPYIFNCERSGLPIWPTWESKFERQRISVPESVEEMMHDTTHLWEDLTYDSFLFHAGVDYVKKEQPRVMFVGFGETDEWAHAGRYDHYLEAAHHVDEFVARLWKTVQSMPQYQDKTTFIITADHGRGGGLKDWKDHGEKVGGAEGIWIAVIGPDTAPLGERKQTEPATQSQIAATVAALLGEDFHGAFPKAGVPIGEMFGSRKVAGAVKE